MSNYMSRLTGQDLMTEIRSHYEHVKKTSKIRDIYIKSSDELKTYVRGLNNSEDIVFIRTTYCDDGFVQLSFIPSVFDH